jgi:hypothetical protein
VRSYGAIGEGVEFEMPLETYEKYAVEMKEYYNETYYDQGKVPSYTPTLGGYVQKVAPEQLKKPSPLSSWIVYRVDVIVCVFVLGITGYVVRYKRKKGQTPDPDGDADSIANGTPTDPPTAPPDESSP